MKKSTYRGDIDGLRAIAVIPVIFFHMGVNVFSGGYIGVDVFFVISGYLISGIILCGMDNGSWSMFDFYKRRAYRLLPALYFVIVLSSPFVIYLLSANELKNYGKSVAAVVFFISNVSFWMESGYFDGGAELKPLIHTWSLSLEEQFYMLFPIFLYVLYRINKKSILYVIVFLTLLGLLVSEWAASKKSAGAYYLLPFRYWELGAGVICAILQTKLLKVFNKLIISEAASIVGMLMIVLPMFLYDDKTNFPGLNAAVPVVGASVILIFGGQSGLIGRFLNWRPMVIIGMMSYSLYLWHQPVIAMYKYNIERGLNSSDRVLIFLIVFFASYITWKFVENKFRKIDPQYRHGNYKIIFIPSFLVIILSIFVYFSDGFYSIKYNEVQKIILKNIEISPFRGSCHTGIGEKYDVGNSCIYQQHEYSWAVFGDSHGVELAFSLSERLKVHNEGLRHFTFSSCVPSYSNYNKTTCGDWIKDVVDEIKLDNKIKNVAIAFRINAALHGVHDKKYPEVVIEDNAATSNIWNSYVDIARALNESGKKVYFILQAPELPRPIEQMVYMANISGVDRNIDVSGVSIDWWNKRQKYVLNRIDELNKIGIVIDPAKVFCDNKFCLAIKNGEALYFDNNHVSLHGANLIAKLILNEK